MSSEYCDLVDSIVRSKGALAVFAEVYVDESGTDDASPVTVVAGYLFLKKKAKRFSKELAKVQRVHKIPYCHMSEMAHLSGVFKGRCREESKIIEKKLIRITREQSVFGFAIALHKETYNEVVPEQLREHLGGEYTFCLIQALAIIKRWVDEEGFDGKITYAFEAGHKSQREATRVLSEYFTDPDIRYKHRMGSFAFAEKTSLLPLQAADLLAWLWNREVRRITNNENRETRKDLIALLRPEDKQIDLQPGNLKLLFQHVRERFDLS